MVFIVAALSRTAGRPRYLDSFNGKHIYIETPGNEILTGVLYYEPVDFSAPVLIRDYEDVSLHAHLYPLQHNGSHISNEYRYYITLSNGKFLSSHLDLYTHQRNTFSRMSIMVHIPNTNIVLVGQLKRGNGYLPTWIPQ